jgi:hypothetical protein
VSEVRTAAEIFSIADGKRCVVCGDTATWYELACGDHRYDDVPHPVHRSWCNEHVPLCAECSADYDDNDNVIAASPDRLRPCDEIVEINAEWTTVAKF